MSYLVSLETLSSRVLQRANLEGASAFIKAQELTDLINGSIAEWVDEVRGTTWNGSYSRSSQTISTVNGTQTYALAAGFLSLISVDVAISGGVVVSARSYQEEERNAFRNLPMLAGWGIAQPIYYQIQGSNISFIPVPSGTFSVTVNYVPTATVLVLPADTIDSINGWEEFIVLDAAIKCVIKAGQNDTVAVLTQRLEQQRARIRSLAPRRDQQFAERVHVIENAGGDGWDW
jgi:hypothetical protein